jgi:hypothetical protein
MLRLVPGSSGVSDRRINLLNVDELRDAIW